MLIEIIKSVFLGIVQGVTEWLPVSSTGHLILADEFIRLDFSAEFKNMFIVVIQIGSVLAVAALYFKRLNPFSAKLTKAARRSILSMWSKIIVAVIPAAVAGLFLDDLIDEYLHTWPIIAIALIVYGVLFILLETGRCKADITVDTADGLPSGITYRNALFIGCFQALALIPGTSRSGATILGGMFLGLSRSSAAAFSFFMAVPTMLGAGGLKAVKYFAGGGTVNMTEIAVLLTGMLTSFAVSIAAIKFLLGYVRTHDFRAFGWYRIILGAVIAVYFGFFR